MKGINALAMAVACCFIVLAPAASAQWEWRNGRWIWVEPAGAPDDFSTGSMTGERFVTQLDFVKWFVALSGDSPLFDELSTFGDYRDWAHQMGFDAPKRGWDPNGELRQDVIVEWLVEVFDIEVILGENPREVLLREGIFVPNEASITYEGLQGLVDEDGLQARLREFAHGLCSPIEGTEHEITTEKCTPPPPPVSRGPERVFLPTYGYKGPVSGY